MHHRAPRRSDEGDDNEDADGSAGNDVNTLCRHTAGDTTSRRMAWLVDAKASRSAVPSRGAMADAKTLLGRAAKLAAEAAAEGADEDGMLRREGKAGDNETSVEFDGTARNNTQKSELGRYRAYTP